MGQTVEELLTSKRDEILRIAPKYGASKVRVFGSVARGEAGAESDVDLLVELEPGRSLPDHIALFQDLQEAVVSHPRGNPVADIAVKRKAAIPDDYGQYESPSCIIVCRLSRALAHRQP